MGRYYAQLLWADGDVVHHEVAFYATGTVDDFMASQAAIQFCERQLAHPDCEVDRARVIDGDGDLVWQNF